MKRSFLSICLCFFDHVCAHDLDQIGISYTGLIWYFCLYFIPQRGKTPQEAFKENQDDPHQFQKVGH